SLAGAPQNLLINAGAAAITPVNTVDYFITSTTAGVPAATLAGGTLIVNSPASLTGGLQITGGALQGAPGTGSLLTNGAYFNNAQLPLPGSNPSALAGPINLNGGANPVTVTNSAASAFAGVVSSGSTQDFTKLGNGTLVFSGGNVYSGRTFVNA